MTRKYLALLCLALAAGWLAADGPKPGGAPDKGTPPDGKPTDKTAVAKPGTCKVEKGPIKVEVALKGVVEAEQMTELVLKPEAWTNPLVVLKAVEHGTPVKSGDVLVQLDLEKISQAVRDLKAEQELADLAVRQAEEELPVLEKGLPLDLAAAERGKKLADEDLKKFLETDRPLAEQTTEQEVKTAAFSLEYARDELKQLQKMYRSKDLTEETEEMVLKRHKNQVEMMEFMLKTAKTNRDNVLKVDLPRKEVVARENVAKAALALDKAKASLALGVSQKRLALEKLKYDHNKALQKLKDFQKDYEAMTVRAPCDGVAYHGKCVRGQWPAAGAGKLQRGGTIAPDEVFLTVVAPGPVFVRAAVEEKDLHLLVPGPKGGKLSGKVTPAAFPGLKVPAELAKVAAVPQGGTFEARVAVTPDAAGPALVPGMACTAKFVAYRKDDALTLPASAVFADDGDDDAHHVYLPAKGGGKPEKRAVKVGKTAGDHTEVVDGLAEGDEVLTSKP
jgi:multidrug efflux pump subunit AcrA (membrane-fusion protein)